VDLVEDNMLVYESLWAERVRQEVLGAQAQLHMARKDWDAAETSSSALVKAVEGASRPHSRMRVRARGLLHPNTPCMRRAQQHACASRGTVCAAVQRMRGPRMHHMHILHFSQHRRC
jgi:hypothetical protein